MAFILDNTLFEQVPVIGRNYKRLQIIMVRRETPVEEP